MLYDKDIREPLFDYLEDTYGKSRIIEEKVMGKARADVILILPDKIIGLEIKSSVDTYERLKKQVRNYDKYCDENYIVVGLRHIKHIEEHVPKYWGILCIYQDNNQIVIEERRPAQANPKVTLDCQLGWMWRNELDNILALHHLPKYKQKSKAFVSKKLMEKVDLAELKTALCDELFERDYTLWPDEKEDEQEYPAH